MKANYVKVLGLSFLEFSGNRPERLTSLFDQMGFSVVGQDPARRITLHNQEGIYFISNPSSGGNTELFRAVHRRGASAMGFKVENAKEAYELALELGAKPAGVTDYDIPAIRSVGQALIYLVDDEAEKRLFASLGYDKERDGVTPGELKRIDHLTHNLRPGGIARVAKLYGDVFGFGKVRSFDIEGKKTGLYSEVIASPCGSVIIPLNETKDDKSQIAEFIDVYNGEGIQHIALHSSNIYDTVDNLGAAGIPFQDTPETYYELIDQRLPGHGEKVSELYKRRILIDGGERQGGGFLLQIFTKNSIGPIFFEFIQRKGNKGFGEGNFQALFESIELDQERRGVLA
jgi:4-hydroxyphenylpyruvate dioxygenase